MLMLNGHMGRYVFVKYQAHTVCTCMTRFLRSINSFVQITAPSSSVVASNCTLNEIC